MRGGKIIAHPFIVDFKNKLLSAADDPRARISLDPTHAASYIIFQDEGMVKAKNGQTGEIEFSGTDAATVIQQAINALRSMNREGITITGKIFIKRGTYDISQIVVWNGITLHGENMYSTELRAKDSNIPMIVNAFRAGLSVVEDNNIVIENLFLNGNRQNLGAGAGNIIDFDNVRHVTIRNCLIANAQQDGIVISNGGLLFIYGNRVIDCVRHCMNLNVVGDSQIFHNDIGGPIDSTGHGIFGFRVSSSMLVKNKVHVKVDGIHLESSDINQIIGNHLNTNDRYGLATINSSYMVIGGNMCLENGYDGIYCEAIYSSAIVGNVAYNNGRGGVAGQQQGIFVHSGGGNSVLGNICFDNQSIKTQQYGIRARTTFKTVYAYNVLYDNSIAGMYVDFPVHPTGKIERNLGYVTENAGVAIFSGTGTQTTFVIPHGLVGTPTSWRVEAGSADARGNKHVTADAMNLYVVFATAPPAGTNNVVLVWQAEM